LALFGRGLRERGRERRGDQRGCHRRRQDMREHGELVQWDGVPRCTLRCGLQGLDLRGTKTTIVPRWLEAPHDTEQAQQQGEADRSLLLANAQRLEDTQSAGRMRPAVPRDSGEYCARRSVQAGFSENLTEQPDAGDRLSAPIMQSADAR